MDSPGAKSARPIPGGLGEKLGVSQVQVSQWETGEVLPSPEQSAMLAELFGRTAPVEAAPPKPVKRAGAAKAKEKNGNGANLVFEA